MTVIHLLEMDNFYSNIGQEAQRRFIYTYTGRVTRADNVPHTVAGDCEDIQIKSARASVCKGTDIETYLETDAARRFAYVLKDFTRAYIMDKITYIAFVKAFGTVTRESTKNGGATKIRLKSESKAMLKWLRERV